MPQRASGTGTQVQTSSGAVIGVPGHAVAPASPPPAAARVDRRGPAAAVAVAARRGAGVPLVRGAAAPALAERVLDALAAAGGPVAPRELERRLGVSRSALGNAVRLLTAAGRITRVGRGPATRLIHSA